MSKHGTPDARDVLDAGAKLLEEMAAEDQAYCRACLATIGHCAHTRERINKEKRVAMAPGEYETVPETCGVCCFNYKTLCSDNLLINVNPAKSPPSGEAPYQCPRRTWAQKRAMGLVG